MLDVAMQEYTTLTDTELARQAQIHQGEWLEELFRRFERRLFGCAHQMVAPREVEDAVQNITVRIMRGLPGFRGESSLSTWIYSVARHTCLDVLRRRRETEDLPDDELLDASGDLLPERAFETSVIACRTTLAIEHLPAAQQDVVLLRLGAGLSTEETARQLDLTLDAVKSKLRRARSSLRSELEATIACPQCGPGAYSLGSAGIHTS